MSKMMRANSTDHLCTFKVFDNINTPRSIGKMTVKLRIHDENAVNRIVDNARDIAGIVEQTLADSVMSSCIVDSIAVTQITRRDVLIRRKTVQDLRNESLDREGL